MSSAAIPDDPSAGPVLRNGDLVVEVPARCVRVHDQPVALTRSEFEILVLLARRAGRPVSKDELARAVGPHAAGQPLAVAPTDADRRNIEVHVANLRRKLSDGRGDPRWIQTVRGVGYELTPQAHAPEDDGR